MKKMVLVLTLAAFALSGSAFAQDPNYSDNIGLYLTPGGFLDPTAEDGTASCGQAAQNIPFSVFVTMSQMTNPEVWGWEAKITPINMSVIGVNYNGVGVIDAGTKAGEYIVGISEPLVASGGAVLLAEFSCSILSFNGDDAAFPSYMLIDGTYFSSDGSGLPLYLNAPTGDFVTLHNIFGDPYNPDADIPQLIMNGDCFVVGVEEDSWGSVKSMFR